MGNIDFSVAMSVYKSDDATFFKRSLVSITEEQTVKPSEIVLVVDGPVGEDINSVIAEYEEKYEFFKTVRLEENAGLGNALKIAVENCRYELVARMDSDDVAVSDRFEQQLRFFENDGDNGIDLVGGDVVEFIDDEQNKVSKRDVPTSHAEIVEFMKSRCPFNHPTVMFRKSVVLSVGGYMDWHWNEDYYLWIRMYLGGAKFANTGTVLVNMRSGEDMYSRRGGKRYFESEKKIHKLMLDNKIIGRVDYFKNVLKRFIVECCLPNAIRGWAFRKFARKSV